MTASQKPHKAFRGVHLPDAELIAQCMHCGLCLPHCPTYALTVRERSSPRGRIRLIKAVAEGELPLTDTFVEEMEFCLDCQACETACPAGVKYGALVEAARNQIFEEGKGSLLGRIGRRLFLDWFFSSKERFHRLSRLLRLYQKSGLKGIIDKSGILALISRRLNGLQPLAPTVSDSFSSNALPELVSSFGARRSRVAFLTGCIMDVAYADVNIDTVELLRLHQCEVVIPRDVLCCGSLQAHNGLGVRAKDYARRFVEAFSKHEFDAVVMNSAGCGAFAKEYGHVLKDDPALRSVAADISAKTYDITEFLVKMKLQLPEEVLAGDLPHWLQGKKVTYHDACHLVHTQKVSRQPRDLLRSIPGINYVELPEATWCCGSAGIYNVVQYDDSMNLLARKVENIASIAPDIIVTGNPGCMIQIQHGLSKKGMKAVVMHTATFLRRVCEAA